MESQSRAHRTTPLADAVHHRQPSHLTDTHERGAFALAECSCGWRGPARRSRDKARTDAADHAAAAAGSAPDS
ncbi:hypothetical protein [Streptomyces sp. NPDC048603]|uniref:hypothetical protein n=1 Tax=Streptomyces sp. NPDC048603 TaxID=3365577 RepID=UPI00371D6701